MTQTIHLRPGDPAGEKLLVQIDGGAREDGGVPPVAQMGMAVDRSAPFSQDPKHMCCRFHSIGLARIVAFLELIFSFILFVTVISLGCTQFSKPAVGPILGGVSVTVFAAVCAALVLVGLYKQVAAWLLPYLIFKGFQMVIVSIFLVVCLLGLTGFSFIYGLVASSDPDVYQGPPGMDTDPWAPKAHVPMGGETGVDDNGKVNLNDSISLFEPEAPIDGDTPKPSAAAAAVNLDDHEDEGEAAVNQVTVVFAALLTVLMVVIFVLVFFIIILFKAYRCLKERAAPPPVAHMTPNATFVIQQQPPSIYSKGNGRQQQDGYHDQGVGMGDRDSDQMEGGGEGGNDTPNRGGVGANSRRFDAMKAHGHVRNVSTGSQTTMPMLDKGIGSFEIPKEDCDCRPRDSCHHRQQPITASDILGCQNSGGRINAPFMDDEHSDVGVGAGNGVV